MGAVVAVKLGEDVIDVVFHRLLAEVELPGDLLVGAAFSDQNGEFLYQVKSFPLS